MSCELKDSTSLFFARGKNSPQMFRKYNNVITHYTYVFHNVGQCNQTHIHTYSVCGECLPDMWPHEYICGCDNTSVLQYTAVDDYELTRQNGDQS